MLRLPREPVLIDTIAVDSSTSVATLVRRTMLAVNRLSIPAAALTILQQASQVAVPIAVGLAIDRALDGGDRGSLVVWLLVLSGLYGVRVVAYRMAFRLEILAMQLVGSARSNQVIGSFRGAETVAAFGLGDHQLDRIGRATWPVVRYGLVTRIVSNRFFGRLTASELAGLAGLLVVGYWLVDSGRATIGAATAGMLLVFRLFQPLGQMLLVLDVTQTGLTSLARIVGVIQMPTAAESTGTWRSWARPVPARRRWRC